MTLADIITQTPNLDALRPLALVFSQELCQRLVNVQAWHGDPRHVPNPVPLSDGRWMLRADVLAECGPGGLVYGGFSRLDAGRFDEIEVVPIAGVVLADPPPPQLTPEEQPPEPEPEGL